MENIKKLLKTNKKKSIEGYCSIAFTHILINEKGEIFCCGCEGWVKKSVGNILNCNSIDDFQNLLSNDSDFKKSILNKNYNYCNAFKCFYLQENIDKNVLFPFELSIDNIQKLKLTKIYLQIDESCNLECPSCRSKKILHRNNTKTQVVKNILKNLNDFILPNYNNISIRLVGNGELFASHSILPWLLNFDFEKYKTVKFYLHTNATLLYKHEDFLNKITNYIDGFEISIDAAYKNTYSIVRKGGNWNHLMNGLEIVKKIQEKNKNINVNFSFVVSSINYREMEEFIKLAKIYNSNFTFYKILQFSMNKEEFASVNVFSPLHPNHKDFKDILKKLKHYKSHTNFLYLFNDL